MKLTTATILVVLASGYSTAQQPLSVPETALEVEVHRPVATDTKPIEVIVPPIARIELPGSLRPPGSKCIEEPASWGRSEVDEMCATAAQ